MNAIKLKPKPNTAAQTVSQDTRRIHFAKVLKRKQRRSLRDEDCWVHKKSVNLKMLSQDRLLVNCS